MQRILSLREQAQLTNGWLKQRLETILPALMKREGLDMWIVIARENNEDQVLFSLLPAPLLSARRRTILVFWRREDGSLERLNLGPSGSEMDLVYSAIREDKQSDQWQCLAQVVRERRPRTIGINCSEVFAAADGLTATDHSHLHKTLTGLDARVSGTDNLAVGWLEQRLPVEIEAYDGINRIAHAIIAQAFSSHVILPGQTTALDVAWWIRQRIHDLGFRAWFHPTVDIQRRGAGNVPADEIIRAGDLLHCDVGLHYLGLATDTQHLAYVRHPGEDNSPRGLELGLSQGNKLQDITAAEFKAGRTGNEILAAALATAAKAGIKARIYTHPIGIHGHGSGPTIGLYEQQDGVPGSGDYPLHENTCYALELGVTAHVTEWDQEVTFPLEQTVAFSGGEVKFLGGRQTRLHLV